MQVETFEVVELNATGEVEDFEQIKAEVEKLGLPEQEKFLKKEEGVKFPYRKITAQEKLVYLTICSSTSEFKKFGESLIPLRILQVASYVMQFPDLIDRLEVWHCSNGDVKDPVLIGRKGDSWSGEYYILARWGEVLEPFAELTKVALAKIKTKFLAKYEKELAEAQAFRTQVESFVESKFLEGRSPDVSFYTS